jgi:hypothetical protein
MFIAPEKREVFPNRESSEETITKLSQAIREGAKLRPIGKGFLLYGGRTCALGAALEGLGHKVIPWEGTGTPGYSAQYEVLYDRFGASVCQEVFMFNDEGWTRERIADWLEKRGQ